jgi:hypothetical protein
VHNIKKLISFEELELKNTRWARSIFFSRKSFELSYSKSRESRCAWEIENPSRDEAQKGYLSLSRDLGVGIVGEVKVEKL